MKRWMFFFFLASLLVFTACDSGDKAKPTDGDDFIDGDEDGDEDGDASEDEAEKEATIGQFGDACQFGSDCESGLCYAITMSEKYCSIPCSDTPTCSGKIAGACCRQIVDRQYCLKPNECITDGDEEEDSDQVVCEKDQRQCKDKMIQICSTDGKQWVDVQECTGTTSCQNGYCISSDGDADTENSDAEEGSTCRDSTDIPGNTLVNAESLFLKDQSKPADRADLATSLNHGEKGPGKYVRLDFSPVGGVRPDPTDALGSELVFYLDIDVTYDYYIIMDYVCGKNFGEAGLFLDESNEPLERDVAAGEPADKIDLNCQPANGADEELKQYIAYKSVCLAANDNHKLRVRIMGAKSSSLGYTLGVDFIKVIPVLK